MSVSRLAPSSGLRRPGSASSASRIGTSAGKGVSAGLSKGSLANLEDEALEASERDEEEDGERERTRSPYKRPESMASQVSQASSTTRRVTQEEEEKDPFDLRDTDSRRLTTEAVCSLSRRIWIYQSD